MPDFEDALHEPKTPTEPRRSGIWRFLRRRRLLRRYLRRRRYASGKRQYQRKVQRLERACRKLVDQNSVTFMLSRFETLARRYPKGFRGVNGRILAQGYLRALEEGALDDAASIARLLRERLPQHYSRIQEREFISFAGRRLVAYAPNGAMVRTAVEALEGMGYRISPEVLLATALLSEDKTPANVSVSGDKALTDLAQRQKPSKLRERARTLMSDKRARMIAAGRRPSAKRPIFPSGAKT
jgi:hypothetical protein